MTDARVSAPVDAAGRGFQPVSRRRNRIALGVLLAAIAIGGNIWVYATLDSAEPVVQAVRDRAGRRKTVLVPDMLRTVEVDADSTVNLVAGDQLDSLVGSYAKVRLVSGSLVTAEALQSTPLVSAGSFVVAIQVGEGTLPIGVRERAAIMLVIPGEAGPTSIDARVVGLPVATRPRRSASNRCRWRSTRATPQRRPWPTTSASCWWNRATIPPPNRTVDHDNHCRHR